MAGTASVREKNRCRTDVHTHTQTDREKKRVKEVVWWTSWKSVHEKREKESKANTLLSRTPKEEGRWEHSPKAASKEMVCRDCQRPLRRCHIRVRRFCPLQSHFFFFYAGKR